MTYVLDTSSFIVMGHYFPERFPSFWQNLEVLVEEKKLISVREVREELAYQATKPHLQEWLENHRHLFILPQGEETIFVRKIFAERHFQQLLSEKQRLKAGPAADPWVIACAKVVGGCVVTEEVGKANAAKIPNVCTRFAIDHTSLEGMMAREGWKF